LLAELKPLNVRFGFYDIDNDQGMRHWLKLYTGWKTFPQIFIKGELLGGLDVMSC
jgi:glutaredoxin-related protein